MIDTPPRTIIHVDLDAFFTSVEQRDNPTLRGKPVVVGGNVARGVVAAASYEAREYGIHSAMPMAEAMRRCPKAIVVHHNMDRYLKASREFRNILGSYSPLVEPLSVDEAFVDVTGSRKLFGDGPTIAKAIRARITEELSLTASVGIAPNKFVAKVATESAKPDGFLEVADGGIHAFLGPLPIARLWGVGPAMQSRLAACGIVTIADLTRYPQLPLRARLGSAADRLLRLANGLDTREVVVEHSPVTIGHEETFEKDIGKAAALRPTLLKQAEKVAARLRHGDLRAGTVVLKIKFGDFRQLTRRRKLVDSTCDGIEIFNTSLQLLRKVAISDSSRQTRVRLCGVAATDLVDSHAPTQLALDQSRRDKGETIGHTLDAIRSRFGDAAMSRGDTS